MKKFFCLLALANLLVLTGCGNKEEPVPDPEPPAAEEPIVTPEPEAEPEPAVPAGMNPLTGLPMEPEYERNRPVAVMLNNLKKAQPQLGNAQADIVVFGRIAGQQAYIFAQQAKAADAKK